MFKEHSYIMIASLEIVYLRVTCHLETSYVAMWSKTFRFYANYGLSQQTQIGVTELKGRVNMQIAIYFSH